jgi:cation diffusion facilitator CzcD-associated flavoprotein CzcO
MEAEHLDVLIVGGGVSGIGAAAHLELNCPTKSYAVLEMRDAIGGTWDLFRYPGVRSDSDMFTFGYSFKPWSADEVLADGESIRNYVRETAEEYGVVHKIRFHHRVHTASWSSEDARWTLTGERVDTGETFTLTASFVVTCTGYYNYDEGYAPEFPGAERFNGTIVHPQFWPEELDYEGKHVVIIGSGATAVTLVPAMAGTAKHVTMLQRSPSYVLSLPAVDPLARALRRFLSEMVVHRITRAKNIALMFGVFKLSRSRPRLVRKILRRSAERHLPDGYDVDVHFNPSYDPWDQRMCFVPGSDLFNAIASGEASVVTDQIETFTEQGLRLASGREVEADIVVSATGLKLLALGGLKLSVDGQSIDIGGRLAYRAMMLEGVPNLGWVAGYTNMSWTLRCNLTCAYICRLLNHMDAHGYRYCIPRLDDPTVERQPFVDLKSGYVRRGIDSFPKQGPAPPWRGYQNYLRDLRYIGRAPLEDGVLRFEPNGRRPSASVASRNREASEAVSAPS